MKKLLIAILAIACLAATAVGCSKNDNSPTVTTDIKETIATPVDTDDDLTEAVDTDEVTDDEDETTDEAEVTDKDVVTEEDPTENTASVVNPVETESVVDEDTTVEDESDTIVEIEDEFDPNYDYEGEFEELAIEVISIPPEVATVEFDDLGFPTNLYPDSTPLNIAEEKPIQGLIFIYEDDPNFDSEIIKATKTPDEVANNVPFEFLFKNMNGFILDRDENMLNWRVYSEGWTVHCNVSCYPKLNNSIDAFNISCGELKGSVYKIGFVYEENNVYYICVKENTYDTNSKFQMQIKTENGNFICISIT